LATDDDGTANDSVDKAVNPNDQWSEVRSTFLLYAAVGIALTAIFEYSRKKRSVYARRTTKMRHRAPPTPGRWPLQWLVPVILISDEECKRMVGLDG
jgi:hypothetical protein